MPTNGFFETKTIKHLSASGTPHPTKFLQKYLCEAMTTECFIKHKNHCSKPEIPTFTTVLNNAIQIINGMYFITPRFILFFIFLPEYNKLTRKVVKYYYYNGKDKLRYELTAYFEAENIQRIASEAEKVD